MVGFARIPLTFSRAIRLSLIGRLESQHAALDETSQAAISREMAQERPRERTCAVVEVLLKESLGAVYRYCLRLTRDPEQALDLTQETMLKAWRSRQMLASPNSARPWLLKIASNCWNDQLRGKPRQPQPLVESPPSGLLLPEIRLEQQEAVRQALAALDKLPERQRQVMYLVTIEQLPRAEVAYVLQISPSAVKANLSAARRQLRAQLKPIYEQFCETRTCHTNECPTNE